MMKMLLGVLVAVGLVICTVSNGVAYQKVNIVDDSGTLNSVNINMAAGFLLEQDFNVGVFIKKEIPTYYVDYACGVFNKMCLGKKGILIFATLVNRKAYIKIGAETSKIISDEMLDKIFKHDIVPHFKQNNFEKGIIEALGKITTIAFRIKKTKEESIIGFLKKHSVKEQPSQKALFANPFVYEGKVIGVTTCFYRMLSATKAMFCTRETNGSTYVIVSDIPRGVFVKAGVSVLMAVQVLGNIDLPTSSNYVVPHLKFVGVHFNK